MSASSWGPYFLGPISLLSIEVEYHGTVKLLQKWTFCLHQSENHSEETSCFYGIPLTYDEELESLSLTAVNHFEIVLLTWAVDVEFPRQVQRLSDV